ncbi:MAG: hypothetical protein LAP13_14285 [Acidobacteriia bacterium]|nr:hypothetical protein [Terriglobia bacterium]
MRLSLSIAWAIAALICFFLPWFQVSCGGVQAFSVSGWQLASGAEVLGERQGGHAYVLIVPLLLLALLVLLLVTLWQGRSRFTSAVPELVAGALCILVPVIEFFRLRAEVHGEGKSALLGVFTRYGFWGMLVCGLALAAGGIRSLVSNTRHTPPSRDQPAKLP